MTKVSNGGLLPYLGCVFALSIHTSTSDNFVFMKLAHLVLSSILLLSNFSKKIVKKQDYLVDLTRVLT